MSAHETFRNLQILLGESAVHSTLGSARPRMRLSEWHPMTRAVIRKRKPQGKARRWSLSAEPVSGRYQLYGREHCTKWASHPRNQTQRKTRSRTALRSCSLRSL